MPEGASNRSRFNNFEKHVFRILEKLYRRMQKMCERVLKFKDSEKGVRKCLHDINSRAPHSPARKWANK